MNMIYLYMREFIVLYIIYTLEVQPPLFVGWFTSFTIFIAGVYHHLKGTNTFKMVVDFPGIYKYIIYYMNSVSVEISY